MKMKSELDIVFSFDDTGSMSSVRKLVRNEISTLVDNIFKHIPTARIGIIIHNDYCDHDTIQYLDLTNDKEKIKKFINSSSSCGGGDSPECYELAINHIHEKMSWESDKKIAALIGDEIPHHKGYSIYGKSCIHDWKEELNKCKDKGIKIYSIQALNRYGSNSFYDQVAKITGGIKLELLQFQYVLQYIMAIFHKENDTLEEYENSQKEFKTNYSLKTMFDKLFDRTSSKISIDTPDKETLWKFQMLSVPTKVSIKQFVESNGIHYKAGKGYYQLTKTEEIQEYKEILMVKKDTDETITDTDKCRKLLGIGRARMNFNPKNCPLVKDYDIYVQSTSYNRALIGGTKFLYELDYR